MLYKLQPFIIMLLNTPVKLLAASFPEWRLYFVKISVTLLKILMINSNSSEHYEMLHAAIKKKTWVISSFGRVKWNW